MLNKEKIRVEGIRLIEKFSGMFEKTPETEETHYVVDLKNITREDGEAVKKKDFNKKMKKIAPRWDEGYVIAEKSF